MPKVLIVDESAGVKTLVGDALQRKRVDVISAASGAEAVERIESERPDLVVCDVYMPDMDGYRICDFVRAHPKLKATPVLLMSDTVDRTILARAARAGCDDVLRKPEGTDELVSRIEGLLSEKTLSEAPFASEAIPSGSQASPTEVLATLAEVPGVIFVALADREGFLIDWIGTPDIDPEVVAAVTSSLVDSSEGIGRELGHGTLQSVMFQYKEALVLVECTGSESRLAVVFRDFAALEAIRHRVKQSPPSAVTEPALPYR